MRGLHILSSDIVHHNRTLLAFLATEIAPKSTEKPQCWVVSQTDLVSEFPQLAIRQFASKKALANALIAKKSADLPPCFFFHGQFNPWVWLAILVGKISPHQCAWHIWGADLYETSEQWAFKLFYPLRRLAQKRLRKVYGTLGDLQAFAKINHKASRELLYFPTQMPSALPPNLSSASQIEEGHLSILLGNSGDPSNCHLVGLSELKTLGEELKICVPMGYPANNDVYIAEVTQHATALFGAGNVEIWREKQPFAKYVQDLTRCNLGYFPFARQQGIGTLCLLILLNIPFALNRNNPFCLDLEKSGVPFLYCEEVSREKIVEVAEKLRKLDKSQIAFFPENYRRQWLKLLGAEC